MSSTQGNFLQNTVSLTSPLNDFSIQADSLQRFEEFYVKPPENVQDSACEKKVCWKRYFGPMNDGCIML